MGISQFYVTWQQQRRRGQTITPGRYYCRRHGKKFAAKYDLEIPQP